MVKKIVNMGENEPEQSSFEIPSETEHLLQVVDIFTYEDEIGTKLGLDLDTVSAKLEVVGGDEAGRTLLARCTLDEKNKGFFATKLLLKSIGEQYKGNSIEIDTSRWIGRQLYANIVHTTSKTGKVFANIGEFNFDKKIEQQYQKPVGETPKVTDPEDIAWDE